jgi:hypothetical protein
MLRSAWVFETVETAVDTDLEYDMVNCKRGAHFPSRRTRGAELNLVLCRYVELKSSSGKDSDHWIVNHSA